jgi:transcription elongation factor Elf1
MSRVYFNCPYCDKETYVDLERENQGEKYYETCVVCDKKFQYYYDVSVDIYAEELTQKIKEMK